MAPYLVMGSMGLVASCMAFTVHERKGRKLSMPGIPDGLREFQMRMGIAVIESSSRRPSTKLFCGQKQID